MSENHLIKHTGGNGQLPPEIPMAKVPLVVEEVRASAPTAKVTPIAKPVAAPNMDRFKSKRGASGAGVETLQTALPHYKISEVKDFSRLHPDEDEYWSDELCFVSIPIKGQKRDLLHLIDEDLVPPDVLPQVLRFRLALASKPYDVFYLCQVASQNLDNSWNASARRACENGKATWIKAVSKKEDGAEEYQITTCRDHDAFPEPKWPKQGIYELIAVTFGADRSIDREDHPALLRLVGAKQSVA